MKNVTFFSGSDNKNRHLWNIMDQGGEGLGYEAPLLDIQLRCDGAVDPPGRLLGHSRDKKNCVKQTTQKSSAQNKPLKPTLAYWDILVTKKTAKNKPLKKVLHKTNHPNDLNYIYLILPIGTQS